MQRKILNFSLYGSPTKYVAVKAIFSIRSIIKLQNNGNIWFWFQVTTNYRSFFFSSLGKYVFLFFKSILSRKSSEHPMSIFSKIEAILRNCVSRQTNFLVIKYCCRACGQGELQCPSNFSSSIFRCTFLADLLRCGATFYLLHYFEMRILAVNGFNCGFSFHW